MSTESLTKSSILVVDDSPGNLTILANTLANAGHNTLIASSGDSALNQLSYHLPDLILLDVLMPDIDGF